MSPTAQEEQTRILHALKTWLSLMPDDFTDDCPNALIELLKWRDCATNMMCTQNRSHSILLQLPQEFKFSEFFLDLKVFIHHRSVHPEWKAFSSSVISQIFRIPPKASGFDLPVQYDCYSPQEPFSQPLLEIMKPHECAWHITCITGEIYRRIRVKEFVHRGWRKSTGRTTSPNLIIMVNAFNSISLWACEYVLSKSNLDQRVSALAKVIDLADNLLKINNVFSSVAVVEAIKESCLQRLKATLAKLPKKSQKTMQYLINLTDPSENRRSLRTTLSSTPGPPTTGLYLNDILLLLEDNPSTIGTQINFTRCRMFSGVIEDFLAWQQVPFTPPPALYRHPHKSSSPHSRNLYLVQQMLLSTTHRSYEDMWDLSLVREPRRPRYLRTKVKKSNSKSPEKWAQCTTGFPIAKVKVPGPFPNLRVVASAVALVWNQFEQ
ncbi:nucleotide exchange factor RasGEF P [Pelomyxa schiedti]|nr:nucleotide exchange factor RasGEF P [Pelomyxa schiedti]